MIENLSGKWGGIRNPDGDTESEDRSSRGSNAGKSGVNELSSTSDSLSNDERRSGAFGCVEQIGHRRLSEDSACRTKVVCTNSHPRHRTLPN